MSIRLISLMFAALLLPSVAHSGDEPNGARLAESCSSCHGSEGRGGGAIPRLAGQDEATLKARMHELASDDADGDATIMPRLLRAYDDADIAALARYFSQVKP